MRRRFNRAAVGATGVLAAIVATAIVDLRDEQPSRPGIEVPQAGSFDGVPPGDRRPRVPTVFIPTVPPVAVTSASSVVQTPTTAAPPSVRQVRPPAKNPPVVATPPKKTAPPGTTSTTSPTPSYWDGVAHYARKFHKHHRDSDDDRRGDRGGRGDGRHR
ncbi:hypothetical protein [Kibdelosporangium phytohabitans]|uniref:Uncharacterized protein n=1 Tax=Kibdelosporangium phytohabitans TaxID=860235 RepID=A0A0N9IB16_9PSEU|nr:hypothetical protein [Kibdelosporangium phytohabitans]ALG11792.1 hypothetical protein AOZ06_37355 [Kibdelosporangium phytohabitans]MBE1463201.1 hypothetical protein [Kibdelosporangium phytohabitans]